MIITSGMGSIGDNGSSGTYAYRSSKALIYMVANNMAVDIKLKGISVMALNPGMVATEFGGFGSDNMAKMGGMTSEKLVGKCFKLSTS